MADYLVVELDFFTIYFLIYVTLHHYVKLIKLSADITVEVYFTPKSSFSLINMVISYAYDYASRTHVKIEPKSR